MVVVPTEASTALIARLAYVPHSCVPWSIVVLVPDVAASPSPLALARSRGPHSYASVEQAMRSIIKLVVVRTSVARALNGDFLCHTHGIAHHRAAIAEPSASCLANHFF